MTLPKYYLIFTLMFADDHTSIFLSDNDLFMMKKHLMTRGVPEEIPEVLSIYVFFFDEDSLSYFTNWYLSVK